MSETEYQIGSEHLTPALLVAFVIVLLSAISLWRRQREIRSFATAETWSRLYRGHSPARRLVHGCVVCVGFALLAIALLDIRLGRQRQETPQTGIEVVFALDVSRSMRAQDTSPNRLERAKQQIRDLVREMPGDRVGLVLFAGDARQVVPLTRHRDDFYHSLDAADPYALQKGGSQLGNAIRVARSSFIDKTVDHRAMVIFTDGEDQESKPVEAAREAHEEDGIRIFTVGLGDPSQGARIPVDDRRSDPAPGFVQFEGETVWSRMNGEILEAIATTTGGAYIPAGTKRVDMSAVYSGYISKIPKSEFATAEINAFIPRFQWFAIPALVCFVSEIWLVTSRRKLRKPAVTTALLVMGALLPTTVRAEAPRSTRELVNEAQAKLAAGDPQAALDVYQLIQPTSENREPLAFHRGVAHFQAGNFSDAANAFSVAAGSSDERLASRALYNLGNCKLAMARDQAEPDPSSFQSGLEEAVQLFRNSLHLDKDFENARVNLELTMKMLEDLQEEPPPEQSSQSSTPPEDQQDNGQESSSDQSPESATEQDPSPQENESEDPTKQNSSGDPSANEQDESDSNSDASSSPNSENTESSEASDTEEQEDRSSQQPESSSEGDKSEDGSSDQSREGETSQSMTESSNAEQQSPPTSEPSNETDSAESESAAGSESQPEEAGTPRGELTSSEQTEAGAAQVSAQTSREGIMSQEEAQKLLQAVRDRAMLRRLLKQQQDRERRIPVRRDW